MTLDEYLDKSNRKNFIWNNVNESNSVSFSLNQFYTDCEAYISIAFFNENSKLWQLSNGLTSYNDTAEMPVIYIKIGNRRTIPVLRFPMESPVYLIAESVTPLSRKSSGIFRDYCDIIKNKDGNEFEHSINHKLFYKENAYKPTQLLAFQQINLQETDGIIDLENFLDQNHITHTPISSKEYASFHQRRTNTHLQEYCKPILNRRYFDSNGKYIAHFTDTSSRYYLPQAASLSFELNKDCIKVNDMPITRLEMSLSNKYDNVFDRDKDELGIEVFRIIDAATSNGNMTPREFEKVLNDLYPNIDGVNFVASSPYFKMELCSVNGDKVHAFILFKEKDYYRVLYHQEYAGIAGKSEFEQLTHCFTRTLEEGKPMIDRARLLGIF